MVHCSCGPRGGGEEGKEGGREEGRGLAARVSNSCGGREEGNGGKGEMSVSFLVPGTVHKRRAWSMEGREEGESLHTGA